MSSVPEMNACECVCVNEIMIPLSAVIVPLVPMSIECMQDRNVPLYFCDHVTQFLEFFEMINGGVDVTVTIKYG